MRAIGIRGVRVSGDVSLPAAKVTSDEERERSIPLKRMRSAGNVPNKGDGGPFFPVQQSPCPAVELAIA